MADVVLENLTKKFGEVTAVKEVDLTIHDQEFTVLLGPSGCGKTTTLRCIAGLEDVTGGNIYMEGRRLNDVLPRDRDIAMVFQNYALYPHMTVYKNMAFGLKLRRVSKEQIDERVNRAAGILGLDELLERRPRELSGGQRQRVAVGRAIVRKPEVFLFDEPLSNLDAKLRVQTRLELKKLHERLATTAVYVTHDQIEAMTMGDRIVVMRDGLIQQIGSPLELYDSPVNKFVGGFIGSPAMNFFDAQLNTSGDTISLQAGEVRIDLPQEKSGQLAECKEDIVVGLRPEDLKVTSEHVAGKTIQGTVEVVEPIGNETYVDFNSGSFNLIAAVGRKTRIRPHSTLVIEPNSDNLHLFDTQSEKAIF